MSPQVLSKNFYTYKCDVWSLAVILFECYFDRLPWKAPDVESLFFQIMSDPAPYLHQQQQPPTLIKSLLNHGLRYLERERYSWDEFLAMQRNRKKIFTDYTRSKSKSITKQKKDYTDLTGGKSHSTIPKAEAEVLHHLICQAESLGQELIGLLGCQCYEALLKGCKGYAADGAEYRRKQCSMQNASWIVVSS